MILFACIIFFFFLSRYDLETRRKIFASERGGLRTENFPILRACELKISQFGGLKIWTKIEAVGLKAKISSFSQKEGLVVNS